MVGPALRHAAPSRMVARLLKSGADYVLKEFGFIDDEIAIVREAGICLRL